MAREPNSQHIIPRTPEGKMIRHALAARVGSQGLLDLRDAEARVAAWLAEKESDTSGSPDRT